MGWLCSQVGVGMASGILDVIKAWFTLHIKDGPGITALSWGMLVDKWWGNNVDLIDHCTALGACSAWGNSVYVYVYV